MKLQTTISAFLSGLALQSHFNAVAGVDGEDRHKGQQIERDVDDTGAITNFSCTLKDGKFMDTEGKSIEIPFGYEIIFEDSVNFDDIISQLTNIVGESIIKSAYTDRGCGERRMLKNKKGIIHQYIDQIAGFDMLNPANEDYGDCTSISGVHDCQKRRDGLTIYFVDPNRRALNSDMDFSAEQSAEDIVVGEVVSFVKDAIENISPYDIDGLLGLSYVEIPLGETTAHNTSPTNMVTTADTEAIVISSSSPSSPPSSSETELATENLNLLEKGNPFEDKRDESDDDGNLLAIFLSLAACSLVCAVAAYKYRQKRSEKNMARKQEDIDAEDQLLREAYEPTKIESMKPLATDHAVVEIVLEEVDLNSKV